jgi:hypothetical protein
VLDEALTLLRLAAGTLGDVDQRGDDIRCRPVWGSTANDRALPDARRGWHYNATTGEVLLASAHAHWLSRGDSAASRAAE